MLMPSRWLWLTIAIVAMTAPLRAQTPPVVPQEETAQNDSRRANECSFEVESFMLSNRDLAVIDTGSGVLFTAGMSIDADGAPNAYAPHNLGLDYNDNARGAQGWVALVTDDRGRPVIQKRGPYRGYYVSTTSLEQVNVRDLRSPKRYIDATSVPYIALPLDFAQTYDIHLGDLAVVMNRDNGRYVYAVFADVGPRDKIGEGSIALARALGMSASPRHGGVAAGVTYLVFPGSAQPARDHITTKSVKLSGLRLYHRWGGREMLGACQATVRTQQSAFSR